MEAFLEFARGPLFRLAFAIMALGLLRHLALHIFGMAQALKRVDSPVRPYAASFSKLTKTTLKWLVPITHMKNRVVYTVTSIIFHIGLILVPVFLFAHIKLWREGVGFGWYAISQRLADVLTLTVIVTGILLFIMRVANRDSRFLSRSQDYLLPWLLIIPFISGYLAMHPQLNPFPYTMTMIIHVLSGELVLVLMPFTKITHCVLYPFVHYASNYAWRFVPTGGEDVLKSLGKDGSV